MFYCAIKMLITLLLTVLHIKVNLWHNNVAGDLQRYCIYNMACVACQDA